MTARSPPTRRPRAARPRWHRPCRRTCRRHAALSGSPRPPTCRGISDARQPACRGHYRGSSAGRALPDGHRSSWHGRPPPHPSNCPGSRPPDGAAPARRCRRYTCRAGAGPAPALPEPRYSRRHSRRRMPRCQKDRPSVRYLPSQIFHECGLEGGAADDPGDHPPGVSHRGCVYLPYPAAASKPNRKIWTLQNCHKGEWVNGKFTGERYCWSSIILAR